MHTVSVNVAPVTVARGRAAGRWDVRACIWRVDADGVREERTRPRSESGCGRHGDEALAETAPRRGY